MTELLSKLGTVTAVKQRVRLLAEIQREKDDLHSDS